MNPPDTIKQRTRTHITSANSQITIRRMTWKAARDFLKMLAQHVAKIGGKFDAETIMTRLPELITGADVLVDHLLRHSTGLESDKLDALDPADALALIDIALELNTGDDLKKSFAGIAEKIGALSAETTMPSSAKSTAT